MSLTLTIAILADLVFDFAPWEKLWYLPFAAGFIVGYLLVGRQRYIIVANIGVSSKSLVLRPWVFYEHDGEICRQKQRNRDLLRRQFLGVHNRIMDMDGDIPLITADWTSDAKYPLFPKFVSQMLVIEDMEEIHEITKIWWRVRAKVTTTYITIAHASSASRLELLRSADILSDQQAIIAELHGQVYELQSAQGDKLMAMSLRMNSRVESTSPENRMFNMLLGAEEEMKKARKEARKAIVNQTRTEENEEPTNEVIENVEE